MQIEVKNLNFLFQSCGRGLADGNDDFYYCVHCRSPYVIGSGPTTLNDFGPSAGSRELSYKDYYNEVRIRYVMRLQIMVQLHCEVLAKEFGANPMVNQICGPV
ncbi:hypothetical protein SAY86_008861 [Trapa natans]|uniref:Uncharacterized protein n=1 Tax=Trapa natans TaxID=22666 RepID=A0AAN7K746_TRANT|nr:hypothetical protein SAY86_008861 [Trapa natans]